MELIVQILTNNKKNKIGVIPMKKLLVFAFFFAFFAGSTALACDSCAAHKKTDKKECATKCDKDGKKCDKEAKKCDKEAKKKDCDKCPTKK
jgi:hypothetical protein